jgi:hypothetical protein
MASTKPKVNKCTSNITQEKKIIYRLCNCSFQIVIMETLSKGKQIEGSSAGMVIISIYIKHSRHQPGIDTDKLFLPVHPLVVF